MTGAPIEWDELTALAETLSQPGLSPGNVPRAEWEKIETTLAQLLAANDWVGILRLRRIFKELIARDSVTVVPIFKRLSQAAIHAAEQVDDKAELAHLLGADGHNLHRQGYHQAALDAFERSYQLYEELGQDFQALQNYYMTSLCYRAMEKRPQARQVLETVLARVAPDDIWRANPLQVLAWLAQDEARLDEAEVLLREAISLYHENSGSEIQAAGALADLGEVVGLQGRAAEAFTVFDESLAILARFHGQYDRQEARTRLKLAELLVRQGETGRAMQLLDRADDMIRGYGHYYDLMWRIETLRAFAYFNDRQWVHTTRKLRLALYYRRKIGLSNRAFAQQLVRRMVLGIGLPR
jgi:tetratricopeptide (TPR) repeat protein